MPAPVALGSSSIAAYTKSLIRASRKADLDSLQALLFPPAPGTTDRVARAADQPQSSDDSPERYDKSGTVGLVNGVDQHGMGPMHHVARVQPCPDVRAIELLWLAGADVNLVDEVRMLRVG